MNRLRILLVDDDDVYWDLAQLAIQRSNLVDTPIVERVRDGQHAIDYLESTSVLPQLLLLDQRMPRMDGMEVLTRVRRDARWQGIAVGLMSSSSQRELVRDAYRAGANFFVVKPVAFAQLLARFEGIIGFWTATAYPPPP